MGVTQAEVKAHCERLEFISELIAYYYTYEGVGGALHIVLDDGNLEDDPIHWCIKYAQEHKDYLAIAIGKYLLDLELWEREAMYEHRCALDSGLTQGWGSGEVTAMVEKHYGHSRFP